MMLEQEREKGEKRKTEKERGPKGDNRTIQAPFYSPLSNKVFK